MHTMTRQDKQADKQADKAKQPRRTANVALHVKLTDEEALQMRRLAEQRGGHMRRVVVEGMEALESRGDELRDLTACRAQLATLHGQLEQERSASGTWKQACSSILALLKTTAAKRALTPTELDIWTLAMAEPLAPPTPTTSTTRTRK